MEDLKNKVIKKALIVSGIIFLASVFIKPEFSLGLLIGAMISVVNFFLLAQQVKKVVEGKFLFFSFFGYIIRYLLMAVALYVSIRINIWVFVGCAVGLFMVRLGMYGQKVKQV